MASKVGIGNRPPKPEDEGAVQGSKRAHITDPASPTPPREPPGRASAASNSPEQDVEEILSGVAESGLTTGEPIEPWLCMFEVPTEEFMKIPKFEEDSPAEARLSSNPSGKTPAPGQTPQVSIKSPGSSGNRPQSSGQAREADKQSFLEELKSIMVQSLEEPMPTFLSLVQRLTEEQWRKVLKVPKVICPPHKSTAFSLVSFRCGHVYSASDDQKPNGERLTTLDSHPHYNVACDACDWLNIARLVRAFIKTFVYRAMKRLKNGGTLSTYISTVPFKDAVLALVEKCGFQPRWVLKCEKFQWHSIRLALDGWCGDVHCMPWPKHPKRHNHDDTYGVRGTSKVKHENKYVTPDNANEVQTNVGGVQMALSRGLRASCLRLESNPSQWEKQDPFGSTGDFGIEDFHGDLRSFFSSNTPKTHQQMAGE